MLSKPSNCLKCRNVNKYVFPCFSTEPGVVASQMDRPRKTIHLRCGNVGFCGEARMGQFYLPCMVYLLFSTALGVAASKRSRLLRRGDIGFCGENYPMSLDNLPVMEFDCLHFRSPFLLFVSFFYVVAPHGSRFRGVILL